VGAGPHRVTADPDLPLRRLRSAFASKVRSRVIPQAPCPPKEAKRQRGKEAKRQRGKEAKRQRGKEAPRCQSGTARPKRSNLSCRCDTERKQSLSVERFVSFVAPRPFDAFRPAGSLVAGGGKGNGLVLIFFPLRFAGPVVPVRPRLTLG
jgi:hypothetical protein